MRRCPMSAPMRPVLPPSSAEIPHPYRPRIARGVQAGDSAEHPRPERHSDHGPEPAADRSTSVQQCLCRAQRLACRWRRAETHPRAWSADEHCRRGACPTRACGTHRRIDLDGRWRHIGQSHRLCRVQRLCRSRGAGDRAGAWSAVAHDRSRYLPEGAGLARGCRPSPPDGRRKAQLLADLLEGYVNIAISRGRPAMALYDPTAAAIFVAPEISTLRHARIDAELQGQHTRGRTVVETRASHAEFNAHFAAEIDADKARSIIFDALLQEASR